MLNFSIIEYFNNSTSFQQIFQHCFLFIFNALTF
nr:MAG TPA: hypothetical protein [Microviridae sp.]